VTVKQIKFTVQQLRRFKFDQKPLLSYLILPSNFPLFENYHFFMTFSCKLNSSRQMFCEIWFLCEIYYTCYCFRLCVCVCVCVCVWHRTICYKEINISYVIWRSFDRASC